MLVQHMNEEHGVSLRQGCRAAGLARSTYRYEVKPKRDKPKRDEEVINALSVNALSVLVARHPAIGFWQARLLASLPPPAQGWIWLESQAGVPGLHGDGP